MENNSNSKNNMNILIGNTLRIGVLLACVIALSGGIWYIVSSSGMGLPDYSVFKDGGDPSYTTFSGIIHSVLTFSPIGWVQLSVVVLMLTPVMRVVLSLVDFGIQRDWLYVVITGIVLFVIIANSLVGVG